MSGSLRLAFTADLHWGSHGNGDEATRLMVRYLEAHPPQVLVLGGDVGAADHFNQCLELFSGLRCTKALVPGNHDIWVEKSDPRGDSLRVYQDHLAHVCAAHGFHYLDHGPLLFPRLQLALVGSINWYDYSWSIDQLRRNFPGSEKRLRAKQFTRGQHNDFRFVRWPLDDQLFTARVVGILEKHLRESVAKADKVIVVTHHPAFYGLSFPRSSPPTDLDGLLWDAFAGNYGLEALLIRYAEYIPMVFCGHTHRARENNLGSIQGYNIGGDYHFKRLLLVDWPAGTVEAHQFGDPLTRAHL